MKQILIVEDDRDILRLHAECLKELNLEFDAAAQGAEGIALADRNRYRLAIIDVNLPGPMTGLEVCRTLRSRSALFPIIIVSGRNSEEDRLEGFEFGADDYLVKPFSRKELQARIKALLRRSSDGQEQKSELLSIGHLTLDRENYLATHDGKRLDLTTMEFDLLLHLALQPGKLFTREELMKTLWGYESSEFAHSITTYFSRLRSKLEPDPKKPIYIRTIHGKGYTFYPDGIENKKS